MAYRRTDMLAPLVRILKGALWEPQCVSVLKNIYHRSNFDLFFLGRSYIIVIGRQFRQTGIFQTLIKQDLLRTDLKQSWGLKNDPSVVWEHNDLWVTDWLAGAWKNTSITGVPRVSGFEKSIKRYLGSISRTRQSGWGHKSVWHKPRSRSTFWSCELLTAMTDPIGCTMRISALRKCPLQKQTHFVRLVSLCAFF